MPHHPFGRKGEGVRMAGLQRAASRPPQNSVFSAPPRGTAEIRMGPGKAHGVNIAAFVNIAALQKVIVAERAYRGM
jgi:hypothetical protein